MLHVLINQMMNNLFSSGAKLTKQAALPLNGAALRLLDPKAVSNLSLYHPTCILDDTKVPINYSNFIVMLPLFRRSPFGPRNKAHNPQRSRATHGSSAQKISRTHSSQQKGRLQQT